MLIHSYGYLLSTTHDGIWMYLYAIIFVYYAYYALEKLGIISQQKKKFLAMLLPSSHILQVMISAASHIFLILF